MKMVVKAGVRIRGWSQYATVRAAAGPDTLFMMIPVSGAGGLWK
jgi:hypothetical protein